MDGIAPSNAVENTTERHIGSPSETTHRATKKRYKKLKKKKKAVNYGY